MQHNNYYKAYLAEREGVQFVEHEHGFATYKLLNDALYLQDIYVHPEHRKSGVGRQLLSECCAIAVKSNIFTILGSTDIVANGARESMLAVLSVGFEPVSIDGSTIWYSLQIKE